MALKEEPSEPMLREPGLKEEPSEQDVGLWTRQLQLLKDVD